MGLAPSTITPAGSSAAAFEAQAGGSLTPPGLPAAVDHARDAGMWMVNGEMCFGKTRAEALERASDLLIRGERQRARHDATDPLDMTFAYAWIAYANACRDVESRS